MKETVITTKRRIFELSLPTIVALSSSTIMGIINLLIISELGYVNTAVVGLSNMFCTNVVLLLVSFSFQVTVVVSNLVGARNKSKLNSVANNTILASLLFNAPIIVCLTFFSGEIMKIFGASPEMIHIGKLYFSIRVFSILLISISRSLIGFLRGLQQTKKAMHATLIANVFNIAIGYILVRHFNFGLLGIGISITISEVIQIAILLKVLKSQNYNFFKGINKFKFNEVKLLYIEGIKIGIQDIGLSFTTVIFTIFAARIGVKELAATEVALNLLSLAYLPGIAIGITASTEVSKLVGMYNRKIENFVKLKKNLLMVTLFFTGPLCLIGGFGGHLIAPFFSTDFGVQRIISRILFISMFFLIFDAFQMVLMDANRGYGDNDSLIVIALGLGIAFFGPFCYLVTFTLNQGIEGMWISFYIYIIIQLIALNIKYVNESKKISGGLNGKIYIEQ